MTSEKDKYLLSSVNNTLSLLDVLASNGALSLADLSRITGFDKTSLFRMTYTLEKNGFITKDDDARYSLGLKLLYLGGSVVSRQDITEVAHPHLLRFCSEHNISVHLARLAGSRVITIDVETPQTDFQITGRVGMSARAHSTAMGRAILANLEALELKELEKNFKYPAYTEHSLKSTEELDALLEKVRTQGFATDINDRYHGFGSLAAPIFDYRGTCIAACGIVSLAQNIEENLGAYTTEVKELASSISADLGYKG